MKKAVALAAVALMLAVIVAVAGCNRGGAPPPSKTKTKAEPEEKPKVKSSSFQKKVPRKIDFSSEVIPDEIKEALEKGNTILVAFFDPDNRITTEMEANLEQLKQKYENKLLFYSYTTEEMQEKQKNLAEQTPEAKKLSNLAGKIGVDFTPHIVIIDGSSNIIFERVGYIDGTQMEQAINDVVQSEKGK